MKVAFLGLGNMGSGMAANIQKAGFDLTVWNRTASKCDPLRAAGAKVANSAAEAVSEADIVFTSLMDDKSIEELLVGEANVLKSMQSGAVHLCVTTISPASADKFESLHNEHGVKYLAAPVMGRPDASASGTLTCLLAGDKDAAEKAKEVCASFATVVKYVGDRCAAANVMKLGGNYLVVSSIEAMSEIYTFAEAWGVDPSGIADIFENAVYLHPAFKLYARKLNERYFDDGGFRMAAGMKDVRLMIESSKAKGVHFAIASIIEDKMMDAINHGKQDIDWSGIHEITRSRSGLK